ncbi:hypothetical protein [Thiohalophilus sp.]|uniref:hypothetical protein n=1 Tax=Thiohalophilus sp. TaxID=3028392 RepID=UPI002ACE817D|nr:hypothetical protein [Thiohalophilus sp.]MDZ7804625.1 hypothetical protein [Thiohalophilus sp.]
MAPSADPQLNALPLARDLPADDRRALLAAANERHLKAGEIVLHQGETYIGRIYLIVTEDERPLGLVSQTDLLRSLISGTRPAATHAPPPGFSKCWPDAWSTRRRL